MSTFAALVAAACAAVAVGLGFAPRAPGRRARAVVGARLQTSRPAVVGARPQAAGPAAVAVGVGRASPVSPWRGRCRRVRRLRDVRAGGRRHGVRARCRGRRRCAPPATPARGGLLPRGGSSGRAGERSPPRHRPSGRARLARRGVVDRWHGRGRTARGGASDRRSGGSTVHRGGSPARAGRGGGRRLVDSARRRDLRPGRACVHAGGRVRRTARRCARASRRATDGRPLAPRRRRPRAGSACGRSYRWVCASCPRSSWSASSRSSSGWPGRRWVDDRRRGRARRGPSTTLFAARAYPHPSTCRPGGGLANAKVATGWQRAAGDCGRAGRRGGDARWCVELVARRCVGARWRRP